MWSALLQKLLPVGTVGSRKSLHSEDPRPTLCTHCHYAPWRYIEFSPGYAGSHSSVAASKLLLGSICGPPLISLPDSGPHSPMPGTSGASTHCGVSGGQTSSGHGYTPRLCAAYQPIYSSWRRPHKLRNRKGIPLLRDVHCKPVVARSNEV